MKGAISTACTLAASPASPAGLRAIDSTAAGWAVPASARPVRWALLPGRTRPAEALQALSDLDWNASRHSSSWSQGRRRRGASAYSSYPAAPPTRADLSHPWPACWVWGHGLPPGRVKPCRGTEVSSWGQGGPQSPGGCGRGRVCGERAWGHRPGAHHTGLAGRPGALSRVLVPVPRKSVSRGRRR